MSKEFERENKRIQNSNCEIVPKFMMEFWYN